MRPHRQGTRGRLAVCAGVAILVAAVMAVVFELGGYSSSAVLSDVAATAELPFWYGAGAAVGVVLWAAMSAACGLTAWLLGSLGARSDARFFLVTGAGLGFLCLDDALQLHEGAFRTVGVSQPQVYAVYAVAVGAWAWRYRARLLASDRVLLVAAVGALATSVAIDVRSGGVPEEYFKLVGICLASVYWADECHRAVLEAVSGGSPSARAATRGADLAQG